MTYLAPFICMWAWPLTRVDALSVNGAFEIRTDGRKMTDGQTDGQTELL